MHLFIQKITSANKLEVISTKIAQNSLKISMTNIFILNLKLKNF